MDAVLQYIPFSLDTNALTRALADDDNYVRIHAAAALGHLGVKTPEAIRQITELLSKDKDSDVWQYAAVALGKIAGGDTPGVDMKTLAKDLCHDSVQVRARAAAVLGAVRSSADVAAAVAALRGALADPSTDVRRIAINALSRLGKPAMPVLIDFVAASKDDLAFDAVHALVSIGGPAIPVLIEAYPRCSLEIQFQIIRVIGMIRNRPKQAIAFVIQALDSTNIDQCLAAIETLGEFGPDAAEAVPRLIHALTEGKIKELEAVSNVIETLGAIGLGARTAIPHLLHFLAREGDPEIRLSAFQAICQIGPSEQERMLLVDYLTKKDTADRWHESIDTFLSIPVPEEELVRLINFYLRWLKPAYGCSKYCGILAKGIQAADSRDCRSLLIQGLQDSETSVVERAAWLIAELSGVAAGAIPELLDALDFQERDACCAILCALGTAGNADLVVPVVVEALRYDDAAIRRQAALALARLAVAAPQALALLREGMQHWDAEDRLVAAFAVRKLDATADEAIPLLLAPLSREDLNLSFWAESLLVGIGRPVVPALLRALHDENLSVDAITDILEQPELHLTPEELTPTVLEYLGSRHPRLRYAGADLVRKLPVKPESTEIIGCLWKGLVDEDKHVRWMSAWALEAVVNEGRAEGDRSRFRVDLGL